MPTYESCHNRWNWKQTIKKTFTLDPGMTCPYCGETQYQTQKSRLKHSALNIVILLPLLLNIFFHIPGFLLLSLFTILFIVVMSLYPFFVEVSSKEEYINFFKK